MFNLLLEGCPNKIFLTFLIDDFFSCTVVNHTGGASWAAKISANFRKNLKHPKWDPQRLGENWFMKKNLKLKISWHCPFEIVVSYTYNYNIKFSETSNPKFNNIDNLWFDSCNSEENPNGFSHPAKVGQNVHKPMRGSGFCKGFHLHGRQCTFLHGLVHFFQVGHCHKIIQERPVSKVSHW